MIRGSVDIITTTEVHGWAFSPARRTPVLAQAVLNHEILGEAEASIHRPDLAAAGLGNGNSGYIIKLHRPIDPLYLPFITVKLDGGDAELPRAPNLGFAEFFAAFGATHPSAGRNRTLLGGLWTDRTDAMALRRGKTAIGQIPADFSALDTYIYTGLSLLPPVQGLSESACRATPREAIQDLLEAPEFSPLLYAILEDHFFATTPAWVGTEQNFAQPSSRNVSPSPAECVECLLPFGDNAVIEVVRNSSHLPEFSRAGASRWTGAAPAGAEHAMLDRYNLPPHTPTLIAPGTIYRLTTPTDAIRFLLLPNRARPFSMAAEEPAQEKTRGHGARILVHAE
jgi:hypothetical protein